jgi:transcriptional regulator with XRE-family HTH domain
VTIYTAPILTPKRLGIILRAARKYWSLTVSACAAIIGVKPTRLAQWETGRATPPLELLQVALLVLRLDPALLINPKKTRGIDRANRYSKRTIEGLTVTFVLDTFEGGTDEQSRYDAFCTAVGLPTETSLKLLVEAKARYPFGK